jgi:RNA polymerase sigma-70 factor (ECF subfamily)
VTDGLANPGLPDPLEERLTHALPRLESHLARRARGVPGVEPEDVAQEVVARALRYRESYDEKRALWPWLRRVAERVLHQQRGLGARQPAPLEEFQPAAPETPVVLDARDELERKLTALRPVEREILLRFHQRFESVHDIARALELPEGTVKSHLSRARRRLADLSAPETKHE